MRRSILLATLALAAACTESADDTAGADAATAVDLAASAVDAAGAATGDAAAPDLSVASNDAALPVDATAPVDFSAPVDTSAPVDAATPLDAAAGDLATGAAVDLLAAARDSSLVADLAMAASVDLARPNGDGGTCATNADCGAGVACAFGRCVTVSDQTYTPGVTIEGLRAAYDPANAVEVGYAFNNPAISGYSHFVALGPWMQGKNVNSGLWSTASFHLVHRPTQAPLVAWVGSLPGQYAIYVGAEGSGPVFNNYESVIAFAAAQNAVGDQFVAAAIYVAPPNQSTRCDLRFSTRPKGGTWSAPATVARCSDAYHIVVGLHVASDGSPAIIVAQDAAQQGLLLFSRTTPIDPWASAPLLPIGLGMRPAFLPVQQSHDGTSHLVFWTETFSQSLSNGDYDVHALTVENGAVSRDVSLGKFLTQFQAPFVSADVDANDTLFTIFEHPTSSASNPYDVTAWRIDAAGSVVTRSLGTVPGGIRPYDAIAVSSSTGELALVHSADQKTMTLRLLTPR